MSLRQKLFEFSAVPNYIRGSPKRKADWESAQKCFGQDPLTTPLPGFTQWLTLGPCIARLLQKWEILLVYFQDQTNASAPHAIGERSARGILRNLEYPLMLMWLKFLNYVIRKIEAANEILQAVDTIIDETNDVMTNLTRDLMSLYIKPQHLQSMTDINDIDPNDGRNMLPLNHIDLGEDALKMLRNTHDLSLEEKQDFIIVCRTFLARLCTELQKRLDTDRRYENVRTFMNTSNALNAEFFLKTPTLDLVFATFPTLVRNEEEMMAINAEWRLLHEVNIPQDIAELEIVDEFWAKVAEITLEEEPDRPIFPKLCELVANLGLIQNSNASAERVWSKSGLVKPKRRNRLSFQNWRNVMLASQLVTDMV